MPRQTPAQRKQATAPLLVYLRLRRAQTKSKGCASQHHSPRSRLRTRSGPWPCSLILFALSATLRAHRPAVKHNAACCCSRPLPLPSPPSAAPRPAVRVVQLLTRAGALARSPPVALRPACSSRPPSGPRCTIGAPLVLCAAAVAPSASPLVPRTLRGCTPAAGLLTPAPADASVRPPGAPHPTTL
jgi:hypothetical protein